LVKNIQYLMLTAATFVSVACGGGGGGSGTAPAPAEPVAAVSTITSTVPLSYGKAAVLTVTGSNLDKGISLSVPGCTALTEQAGATATSRSYTCQVAAATKLEVSASDTVGSGLLSATLPVPDPQVTLVTSLGTITLELNPAKAPISVNNFLKYTGDGFYSNVLFHRVVSSFVIQGGGFTSGPAGKTTTYAPIKLESNNGLSNLRGTLAMARLADPNFDSATSQFFINAVDNLFLNYASATQPQYAVFGKVVDGLAVVDAIRVVPTRAISGLTNVPVTDVVIRSATQTR
jgi:peptidyl-prolyl cis-trans isomerase A (cyclophilin A)/peptidyl-prolyl cis-trans isomerase B (cyclophilin B)